MTEDGRLPLYEEVAARLLFDPLREQQGEATMSVQHSPDADAWTGVTRENLPILGPLDVSWKR
jgi:hypothetical protein